MSGHIFLVGFMGAGKSTVGKGLAAALGMPFIDLDERISADSGMSVVRMFEDFGEQVFRESETRALMSLSDEAPSVVACGGGVVLRDENRVALKSMGTVVYLKVDAAEALARIGDSATRPLLSGAGGRMAATTLLAARESLYTAVADVTIETTGSSPDEVVRLVSASLQAEAGS